jgi:hypothetical protein
LFVLARLPDFCSGLGLAVFVFFPAFQASARVQLCRYGSASRRVSGGDRLHARDVAPDHTHPRRVLELTGRPLEAQIELLLPSA